MDGSCGPGSVSGGPAAGSGLGDGSGGPGEGLVVLGVALDLILEMVLVLEVVLALPEKWAFHHPKLREELEQKNRVENVFREQPNHVIVSLAAEA